MSARRGTEAAFQTQIIQLAGYYGWGLVYHTRDSRGSHPGFPDIVLCRVPELIFAELKTDHAAPRVSIAEAGLRSRWLARRDITTPQAQWLQALAEVSQAVRDVVAAIPDGTGIAAPAVDVYVWTPNQFDDINERLARGRHRTEPLYREDAA